jgi:Secretion system C-terminal sorting domain
MKVPKFQLLIAFVLFQFNSIENLLAQGFSNIKLMQTPILDGGDRPGDVYIFYENISENDIVFIEWTGPNGFSRIGRSTLTSILSPGEYCARVVANDLCTANACIYVPMCSTLHLPNGATILTCPSISTPGDNTVFAFTGQNGETTTATSGISISKIYPNPFSNQITVEIWSSKDQNVNLNLISSLGNSVFTQNTTLFQGLNSLEINLSTGSSLSNGIYYLHLIDSDGYQDAKSLLKN